MTFTCNECGKLLQDVRGYVGNTPIQIPLNTYCSEKCLSDNVEKNKSRPNEK